LEGLLGETGDDPKSHRRKGRRGKAGTGRGESGSEDEDEDEDEVEGEADGDLDGQGDRVKGDKKHSRAKTKGKGGKADDAEADGSDEQPAGGGAGPRKRQAKPAGLSQDAQRASELLRGRRMAELSEAELRTIAEIALKEVPHMSADDLLAEAANLETSVGKMTRKAADARSGELRRQVDARRDLIAAGKLIDAGVGHGASQTPAEWADSDELPSLAAALKTPMAQ
jgi:hypothetical protein